MKNGYISILKQRKKLKCPEYKASHGLDPAGCQSDDHRHELKDKAAVCEFTFVKLALN